MYYQLDEVIKNITENGKLKVQASDLLSNEQIHIDADMVIGSRNLHKDGYEGYTFRPFGTANMYGIQKEGADKTGTSAGLYYEEKQHSQSEKWTHMVITRDWNYDDGESGTGDYFVNIYIDGELVSSLSTQEYDAMLKPFDLNGCDMAIGGMLFKGGGESSAKSANICFAGGIAEFNIYSGVLDEVMVADAYNESSEKYSDAVELKSGLKLLSPLNSSVNPVPLPIKGSIDIVFDNVNPDKTTNTNKNNTNTNIFQ